MSAILTSLQLSTELLITYFSRFVAYRDDLHKKPNRSSEEEHALSALQVLIDYLRKDHQATISKIENLLAHGEITYSLLYAVFIPGTLLISTDPGTGEPCALNLNSTTPGHGFLALNCAGIGQLDPRDKDNGPESLSQGSRIGKVHRPVQLAAFEGVVRINTLPIYPISYHPDEAGLKDALLARGQKWISLRGVHHVRYRGIALSVANGRKTNIKYEVSSIRVDYTTGRC